MVKDDTDNKQQCKNKILLVEDSEICQVATKELLEDLHFHVDLASTAREALNRLNECYNLILLDIGLPDIDGLKLTKMIRFDLNLNIPIIAVTDYAWDKKSYEEVHINDMIRKPVTKQGLTHILKKYI